MAPPFVAYLPLDTATVAAEGTARPWSFKQHGRTGSLNAEKAADGHLEKDLPSPHPKDWLPPEPMTRTYLWRGWEVNTSRRASRTRSIGGADAPEIVWGGQRRELAALRWRSWIPSGLRVDRGESQFAEGRPPM